MNSNSVKLSKVFIAVDYCDFALQYIAYLLYRVFNSNIPDINLLYSTHSGGVYRNPLFC